MAGLEKFRKEKLSAEWDGFATWQVSDGSKRMRSGRYM